MSDWDSPWRLATPSPFTEEDVAELNRVWDAVLSPGTGA